MSDMKKFTNQLARRIRTALGPYNDDRKGVEPLVAALVARVAKLEAELMLSDEECQLALEQTEAKLTKAVKALEKIDREYAEQGGWCGTARTTLAELKEEDRR